MWAQYYHAQAQRSKSVADLSGSGEVVYRKLPHVLPRMTRISAVTNYLLADTLYESKQYLDAAKGIRKAPPITMATMRGPRAGRKDMRIIAYGKQEETLKRRRERRRCTAGAWDSSLKVRAGLFPPTRR